VASSELNVELLKYLLIMQLSKVDSFLKDQLYAIDREKWLKRYLFTPLKTTAHAQWNLKQTGRVK